MTQRQSFGVLIAHVLTALALIVAGSVLAAMHVLSGEAVTGLFGAVLGFVGGASVSQGASIINGGPKPDLNRLYGDNPEMAGRLAKPLVRSPDAADRRDPGTPA
jgi:hypothetical protein